MFSKQSNNNIDIESYDSDIESYFTCDSVNNGSMTIEEIKYRINCLKFDLTVCEEKTTKEIINYKLSFLKNALNQKIIVKEKFPSVYSQNDNMNKNEDKLITGLLFGEMQSGKTDYMIASATQWLSNNCIPIIFCQDRNAIYSLIMKKKEFEKKYNLNFDILLTSDIELDEGSLLNSDKFIENLEISDTNIPKMVISLAHFNQFRKTEQFIRLAHTKKGKDNCRSISLILDEAHTTMYSGMKKKCRATDNLNPEKYEKKPSIEDSLERLYKISNFALAVSATPQRVLLEGINGEGIKFIILCLPQSQYSGIESVKYIEINDIDKETKPSKDIELKKFYTEFSKLKPLTRDEYPGLDVEYKPELAFIKVTNDTDEQNKIFDNITAIDSCLVIQQNSYRSTISVPSNLAKYIEHTYYGKLKFGKRVYKLTDYRFFHLKKNVHIQEILNTILKIKDHVERIVLIGGKMFDAGVSINSSDYTLRITREYLRNTSDSTTDRDQQQCRIVGRMKCQQPQIIYASRNDYLNIILSHRLLQDMIDTFQDGIIKRDKGDILFNSSIDYFKSINVNKDKVPKKKFFTGKKGNVRRSRVFKKIIKGEDDLLSKRVDYINYVRKCMEVNLTEVAKLSAKKGYSNEDERLIKKMFPYWAKPTNTSKISMFMKNLDPEKLYSIDELKEYALNIRIKFQLSHFTNVKIGNTNGYGIIFVEIKNKYKLRDELVKTYLENFK